MGAAVAVAVRLRTLRPQDLSTSFRLSNPRSLACEFPDWRRSWELRGWETEPIPYHHGRPAIRPSMSNLNIESRARDQGVSWLTPASVTSIIQDPGASAHIVPQVIGSLSQLSEEHSHSSAPRANRGPMANTTHVVTCESLMHPSPEASGVL